jgi:4-amino-4-deoxy-L-arabinose transferase-like glycosyltransferase
MGVPYRLAVVLLLALAFRLANLGALARHPLAEYQVSWAGSDMAVNVRWADGIRGGDFLCRDTVHPFYPFHESMAPRATWERWWGGARVFQQAPLYAYVLAGLRSLGDGGFWAVGLGQLAFGLASVALVFLIAARAFGAGIATVAGIGAAVYGPLVFHEAVWLRDSLAVTTSLLALWALGRAPGAGRAAWLLAGLTLAAALLARETALLFVPLAALWAWQRLAGERRGAALAALGLGLALGLLPLVARNLAVEAPALSFSNRALESFVSGHAADSSVTELRMPDSAGEILRAADGSLPRAIGLTLATHGSVASALRWELGKALGILAGYEPPDNVNWYYFAARSPVLRLAPGFAAVLALGLVGIFLERRRGADERLLRWFLLAAFLGLLYGTPAARYRLVAVAVLLVYAAAALAGLAARVRARRFGAAAALALAALALGLGSSRLYADVRARQAQRATEPLLAARTYQRRGQPELALRELRAALAGAWREPGARAPSADPRELVTLLVRIAHRAGRGAEVRPDVDALLAEFPEDPSARALAAGYYRDVLGEPEAAERVRAGAARDG